MMPSNENAEAEALGLPVNYRDLTARFRSKHIDGAKTPVSEADALASGIVWGAIAVALYAMLAAMFAVYYTFFLPV